MIDASIEVATQAYQDQKPGTSGLRKKVDHFQQPNYLENFTQSIYEVIKPSCVVLGGDGRYWSEEAIRKIVNVLSANGVHKIVVPQNGLLSTPAASALIRKIGADAGIILTASHNPGGPDGDFGVKVNNSNGAPAPESITDKIFAVSKTVTSYKSLFKSPRFSLALPSSYQMNNCRVAIIDPVANYADLIFESFNYIKIQRLFNDEPDSVKCNIIVDCMNGVAGPYAKRILVDEIGVPKDMIINSKPLPDFGGKHPDPNLTYAKDLVDRMKLNSNIDFGIAFDGDADRNMVLGQNGFFVSPGDALAIIASNYFRIKQFGYKKPDGFARSFPTSPALDRVCQREGFNIYETPTGWKYFGELLDTEKIILCGEESFGLGANHIREKDGLWACMAWLTLMSDKQMSIKKIVEEHWAEFGRDYFNRYDFENCDSSKCQLMINELETLLNGKSLIGKKYGSKEQYVVSETGDFEYVSPSKVVTSKQGLFIKFSDGSRIIVRLSGTGSCGATVRLYLNSYSKTDINQSNVEFLKELLETAYSITKLKEYTGRNEPDVIT